MVQDDEQSAATQAKINRLKTLRELLAADVEFYHRHYKSAKHLLDEAVDRLETIDDDLDALIQGQLELKVGGDE